MGAYKVEISLKTIILTILSILSLYFLWLIHDLIFSLFIAFILMSALKPAVLYLIRHKVPRFLALVIVYLIFLLFFILIFSLIIPPIIIETTNLIVSLPQMVHSLNPTIYTWLNLNSITQYVPDATSQIFKIAGSIFSNILFLITTIFFSFYLLIEENVIKRFLLKFFNDPRAQQIKTIIDKAEKRMSSWFWGEFQLMTIVGCLSFIGFNLIGLKYALPLAVLAGLLEVVPNMGPILATIPATLVGFSQSPFLGFAALAVSILVQQLENNLIVPIVMRNAVGLNPIVTLIALIIGSRIGGGALGVLLAIPAFLFIETFFTEIFKERKLFDHLKF